MEKNQNFTQQSEEFLKQLNAKIEPQDKGSLDRIVLAGQKIMFAKETHKYMLQMLETEGDIADKLGFGIVQLLGILAQQSKGKIPGKLLIPAGTILLLKVCEFIDRTGGEMSMKIFSDAIKVMTAGIYKQAQTAKGKLPPPVNNRPQAAQQQATPQAMQQAQATPQVAPQGGLLQQVR